MGETDDVFGELLDDLGVDLEPNDVAPQVVPLAYALSEGGAARRIEKAAGEAAEGIWNEQVRADLADGLRVLRDEAAERIEAIDAALSEVERPARKNRLALALVYRAAADLLSRANENFERMAELEERLDDAPPEDHRALALPLGSTAIPAARIPPDEADEAAARFIESFPDDWAESPAAADQAAHWLGRTLATDERREAMRAALHELVDVSAEEFPLASSALSSLLAEPVPDDPAEDDLWVNLAVGVVQDQLGAIAFEDDDLL
jgi:hypothetical protein